MSQLSLSQTANTDARLAGLMATAHGMLPHIAERAAECEQIRRLPKTTEQEFREAGFYKVVQPVRFGGMELDYGSQMELAAKIARACASSGWNLSITACHAWMLGMFPGEAQDDFWGPDPNATLSSSFLPMGPVSVEPEADGYRMSGRWGFSSGCDHCQGVIILVFVDEMDGPGKEPAFLMVPRKDYTIEDTWQTVGLCGTGSNDLIFDKVFVPGHRMLRISDTRGGPTPGSASNPGPIFQIPLYMAFPFNTVGAALGAARGAVDSVAEGLADRQTVTQVNLAEQQSVQLRIAQTAALAETAWNALQPVRHAINEDARNGIIPDIVTKARNRLIIGQSAKLCTEAMDHLFPLLGGRGLAKGNAVQRAWRDVHAVGQHVGLVWDIQAGQYGRVKLGLECPDPKL